MNKQPTVSVVMSVFNGEKYLRESVDSILNQTFKDFEFIIINDGSTDETREILESYDDERIVLINQENMGLTKSLNKGISLAKGKYIARQDADDISKPERLEKEVGFMEATPRVGLLSCWFEFIDETGQVRRQARLPVEDSLLRERLIEINQFSHPGAMIRKEILSYTGLYREYFKYSQDYDLWLRISEKSEISNLPDFLVQYRETENAISSDKILIQSLYAGIARDMAFQRRQNGADDISKGTIPSLPTVQNLSKNLQEKLTRFFAQNPEELIKSWQDDDTNQALVYIFKQICHEKLLAEAELYKMIGSQKEKDKQLQQIKGQLQQANEKVKILQALLEEKNISTNVGRGKSGAADMQGDERLKENQLQQTLAHLKKTEALYEGLKARTQALDEELAQREEKIAGLLNSKSWKLMAPVRVLYDILRRRD